ncbi:MAG TPA: carbon-nitrogen family hydrolase, partial [Acidothermaceae bacterium]
MRVALLQLRIDDSESASARIARVAALVTEQVGADLVVLPELWVPGAFAYRGYQASADEIFGTAVSAIADAAKSIRAFVAAGTFIERDGEQLHNTAVLLSPRGDLLHTYRKLHLFGFNHGEALVLTAGDDWAITAIDGARVGITTCYDLRFPELYRLFVNQGAEMFVIPTGWPSARLEHWQVLTRARALENQVFLIGCNQVGTQEGVELAGHSVVIDPWGRVIAEAGTEEEVLTVDIDLALVAKVRAEFPVLGDRRLGLPL